MVDEEVLEVEWEEDTNHFNSIKIYKMKKLITAILLCVVSISFAQVRVEGIVKDSIGNPLELANVIAINKETKLLDSYGITNDDIK